MEDTTNIVSRMIAQHRILQKELSDAASLAAAGGPDCRAINRALKQFKKDLMAHLELENNVFYSELLIRMEKSGQDTAKTREFINAMGEIGKTIVSFLEKYKNSKIIKSKIAEFKPELSSVINALNLRVESEESGVYTYWGMF